MICALFHAELSKIAHFYIFIPFHFPVSFLSLFSNWWSLRLLPHNFSLFVFVSWHFLIDYSPRPYCTCNQWHLQLSLISTIVTIIIAHIWVDYFTIIVHFICIVINILYRSDNRSPVHWQNYRVYKIDNHIEQTENTVCSVSLFRCWRRKRRWWRRRKIEDL